MLSWILQITIISVIFIILVHHLFQFLKNTLTVPKIKDLVNIPTEKYENMYRTINKETKAISREDLLPRVAQEEDHTMKDELKNFLKKQMAQ